jgi:DNA-directed RNA polymerase subunit beta
MQKQAVPLLVPEAPYIGTGVEARAARDAGEVVLAQGSGKVVEVAGDFVTVEYKPGEKDRTHQELGRKIYPVAKFQRSNQNTCVNQKPVVSEGQEVRAGDVLADGPSTHNGELALGKNLLVAFMPWEGYNTKTPSSCPSGWCETTS